MGFQCFSYTQTFIPEICTYQKSQKILYDPRMIIIIIGYKVILLKVPSRGNLAYCAPLEYFTTPAVPPFSGI